MLRAAFSLALSVVVVFATASVVVRLVSDEQVPSGTRVTGLAWSDRVFTSKREFAEFLAARGVLYEEWAARHPEAAPWQRSGAAARAAGADRGEAAARRAAEPAESAAPAKPAAPEATTRAARRSAPAPAAAPSSPGDGLASRLAPAALVLALVTLLLVAARRVGLRPAVVAVTAAGPALDPLRKRRPSAPRRPHVSTVEATAIAVTRTPAPRVEIVDVPARDGAAEPGRQVGVRLRSLVSAAAAAVRVSLRSSARLLTAVGAMLAQAVAVARAGALAKRREAGPRESMSAGARMTRAGETLAGLAARPGASVASATIASVESVRWFLRGRGFNSLDAATYSLAMVAAAGIGVLIAFVAGR